MAVFAALDIGGTKIAGGFVGGDGTLLFRTERRTPALQGVLDELIAHPMWIQAVAFGIACAGPLDPAKGTGLVGAAAHARGMTTQTVE